jgi:hypothetical protein
MPRRDTGQRTKRFVHELHEFCKADLGRVGKLAKYLKIEPSQVSSWWNGYNFPTTEQLLGAQEWMEKQS